MAMGQLTTPSSWLRTCSLANFLPMRSFKQLSTSLTSIRMEESL